LVRFGWALVVVIFWRRSVEVEAGSMAAKQAGIWALGSGLGAKRRMAVQDAVVVSLVLGYRSVGGAGA
jgi:hypothetical protein